ncbi:MAG: chemotaxis protein CheC, partial [Methylococcales bacterium]|nr:chemotaxis protein CheC [Methylococcales bacterium]
MKALSERHFDALSEIIKNATSRAVQGLSEMIGESIQPSVLKVESIKIENVTPETLLLKDKKFGVLTQTFTGLVSAELVLLFAQENVLQIVQKMLGAEADIETVQECEGEAMCELGNIMMNAYLSSIADTLHMPIDSAVPCYTTKTQDDVAQYNKNDTKTEFVLASHVELAIEKNRVEGKLV